MITEAEIQTIDYTSNSCVVRIPFFETVNTVEDVILEAKFAVTPGLVHGYVVGDMVWVAFENGRPGKPIVIGKVFKSLEDESKSGGTFYCSGLIASDSASLPGTAKITNVDNSYNSLQKVINKIKGLAIDPAAIYDTILQIKPIELSDQDVIITLHIATNQAYPASSYELFKKNLYLAGYTSIDKYKSVDSDESAICGLFVTKNNDDTYKLWYVTSYSNTVTASGYLIQNWDQQTGLMQLTSAQLSHLLNVQPHYSYELPDNRVISQSCLEVSIL